MAFGKKNKTEGQGLLFDLPTAQPELRLDPLTGKPIPKHHDSQRTQHEIYISNLVKPIVTRIKDGDPVVQGQQ